MKNVLVWDLPLRLFHWLFATSFASALVIATTTDDDGATFPLHALFGITAVFLVAFRLVWGFAGTRHARFTSFALHPSRLLRYMVDASAGRAGERYAGHNPATSYFALQMFVVVLGLGLTGFLLGRGREEVKDLHEVLAWVGAALSVLHLAGLAWHTVRHRELVAVSMITGSKWADPAKAIPSHNFGAAALLVLLTGGCAAAVVNAYDPASRQLRLPLTGTVLTIGENEMGERDARRHRGRDSGTAVRSADDDD